MGRIKTISKKNELQDFRKDKLYKRLLEFENNIETEKYTRKNLGF